MHANLFIKIYQNGKIKSVLKTKFKDVEIVENWTNYRQKKKLTFQRKEYFSKILLSLVVLCINFFREGGGRPPNFPGGSLFSILIFKPESFTISHVSYHKNLDQIGSVQPFIGYLQTRQIHTSNVVFSRNPLYIYPVDVS